MNDDVTQNPDPNVVMPDNAAPVMPPAADNGMGAPAPVSDAPVMDMPAPAPVEEAPAPEMPAPAPEAPAMEAPDAPVMDMPAPAPVEGGEEPAAPAPMQ